jgi:hypothetical protein
MRSVQECQEGLFLQGSQVTLEVQLLHFFQRHQPLPWDLLFPVRQDVLLHQGVLFDQALQDFLQVQARRVVRLVQ